MRIGFLIFSLIELWLLIAIGGSIGFLWTVFIFVSSAFIGFFLLKVQGVVFMAYLRDSFASQSSMQFNQFGLQTIGAILLIVPGFLTNVVGSVLILPLLWKLILVLLGKAQLNDDQR